MFLILSYLRVILYDEDISDLFIGLIYGDPQSPNIGIKNKQKKTVLKILAIYFPS